MVICKNCEEEYNTTCDRHETCPPCRKQACRKMRDRVSALEALWQWVLASWAYDGWASDLEGDELEAEALRLGLLRSVPYDPAVHGEMDLDTGEEMSVAVKAEEWVA